MFLFFSELARATADAAAATFAQSHAAALQTRAYANIATSGAAFSNRAHAAQARPNNEYMYAPTPAPAAPSPAPYMYAQHQHQQHQPLRPPTQSQVNSIRKEFGYPANI